MPSSGTNNFNLDVISTLEEAFERAGRSFRSGYDYESAERSLNLMFTEWANDGLNLWTVEYTTVPVVAGVSTYTLSPNTVDAINLVLNDTSFDYQLARITFSDWAAVSDKTLVARPQQVLTERLVDGPRVTLWPVPDTTYTLKVWGLRAMYDTGAAGNTLDVPKRFLEPMVAGLALKLALKNPQLDLARLQELKAEYARTLRAAQGEDRQRVPFTIGPHRWRRR